MADFGEEAKKRTSRQRLRQFVKAVREVLGQVVQLESDRAGRPIFHPELVPAMRSAWEEIGPHFDELERAASRLPTPRLRGHGFSGKLLDFKLALVAWTWAGFAARGGRAQLRRLLVAIDTVLDSLVAAAGTGCAIKDLEEAILGSIDDEA